MKESFYDFKANDINGKEVSMSSYEGKVVLIVNVASGCGFTPQYEGLQKLYDEHKEKGLEILAFCIANKVLDECHLQNIAVIEELRGKGIGTFMLNILFKRAKLSDLDTVLLEVRESNEIARKFYRDNGFKELSVRKNYYKAENGRENAVIMRLEVA